MTTNLFRRTNTHYPYLFACQVLTVWALTSDPYMVLPLWIGYLIARDHL